MSEPKRYELDHGTGYQAYATMEEHADGDYVTYEDYQALRAQVAGLKEALKNLYALVQGEAPSLLEDNHHDEMVRAALARAEAGTTNSTTNKEDK